jgi:cytoskeletal protein CcmA (bactofilin family)
MFATKKPDTITPSKAPTSIPPKPTSRTSFKTTTNNSKRDSSTKSEKTIISKDCFIKGEISSNSDVSICGKVDGIITLKDTILTVEDSGNVKANIFARIINVTGNVVGNIDAAEKIIIHENGNVTGDMTAPKIILKDGSYFKGNVSMTNSKIDEASAKIEKNKSV